MRTRASILIPIFLNISICRMGVSRPYNITSWREFLKRSLIIFGIVNITLSFVSSPSFASDEHCQTPGDTGVFIGAQHVTNNWKVIKNTVCNYRFNLTGPYDMLYDEISVTKRAAHGVAGVNKSIGSSGFAYKPNPGFIGTDTFQVTWKMKVTWSQTPEQFYVDVVVDVVENL